MKAPASGATPPARPHVARPPRLVLPPPPHALTPGCGPAVSGQFPENRPGAGPKRGLGGSHPAAEGRPTPTRGSPCCPITPTTGPEGCEPVGAQLSRPLQFPQWQPQGQAPPLQGEGDAGLLARPPPHAHTGRPAGGEGSRWDASARAGSITAQALPEAGCPGASCPPFLGLHRRE